MRKFLILALALVMILSLSACKNSDGTSDSTPTATDPVDTEPTDTDITDTSNTDEPVVTDDPADTNEPAVTDEPDTADFTSVNETVYVYGTSILNVRQEPSKDSEKVGEMKEGEQVTRIGYNSVWSKISYYGTVCYASSDYLTTSAPLEFTNKTDVVYITAEGTLNLRKKPSQNADIVAYLPYGTELDRTGIATTADAEGITWSRLLYNGEVCYASTSFLSNDKPAFTDIDDEFSSVNETVYVARKNGDIKVEALNVRALPSLSSNSLAVLTPDTELLRIGIAKKADDEGIVWSKVIYDGKTGYVSSNYITKDAPDTDTDN